MLSGRSDAPVERQTTLWTLRSDAWMGSSFATSVRSDGCFRLCSYLKHHSFSSVESPRLYARRLKKSMCTVAWIRSLIMSRVIRTLHLAHHSLDDIRGRRKKISIIALGAEIAIVVARQSSGLIAAVFATPRFVSTSTRSRWCSIVIHAST